MARTAPLLFLRSDSGGPWHWWGYAVAIGSSLPLAARRRAPVLVLLICAALSGLYDLATPVAPQPLWYGVLVALYGVASHSPPRVRIPVFAVMCAAGLLMVGSPDTAARGVVLYVATYAVGRASAGSRAQAAAPRRPRSPNAPCAWNANVRRTRNAPPNASAPASPVTCTASWPTPSVS